ncbi:MAG: hypothetical protein WDN25_14905 [Acetobacteraceae bacterium]
MLHYGFLIIVDAAGAVAMPLVLLALTTSAAVAVAGWNRRRDVLQRQGRPANIERVDLVQTPFAAGSLDVAAEAREVLRQYEGLAAQQLVSLEMAIQPDLIVRADLRAFREIVGTLLACAIDQAPCGRILLGARRAGARVHLSVSDDGPTTDRALRASRLRQAERLAALQGATMEIDARMGYGTTVFVRLALAGEGRRQQAIAAADRPDADRPDPVSVWTLPQRARERSGASR